ncbi:hypothetical protein [Devosia nitrariae]|uniref:Uncharacterized protein n=1 Tax=Devosia nitrariae TaxID=2071872 RepID=A0ABQ5W7S7_9HYPH|nr:hypothetical protein [Devosia nitrariae]GLQ56147.1 hypothetical protein GCM10010862_34060 [Devosia nitrariae]
MKTGWELVSQYSRSIGEIEVAAVRVGGDVRVVSPSELKGWLEKMNFRTEEDLPWGGDLTKEQHEAYDRQSFAIWTRDEIWYPVHEDGLVRLEGIDRTPEGWVVRRKR